MSIVSALAGFFGALNKALGIFSRQQSRDIGGSLAEGEGVKDALKRSKVAKKVRRKPKTDRELVGDKPKRRRKPKSG